MTPRRLIEGAVSAGLPRDHTEILSLPPTEAAEFLAEFLRTGDLLLVKGSRGVKMERIVEALAGAATPRAGPARGGPATRCSTTSSTTSCRNISAR